MRRQPLRLALLLGLGAAVLAGCSHLRRNGTVGGFGSKSAGNSAWSYGSSDSVAQTVGASAGADADASAAPEPPNTNTLEGQFAMARLCERRGESKQAEQVYLALLQKAPQDLRLHHRLAVLAVQAGDFANAEEHFRAAQSLALPTAELLSDIGYCYYLQQRPAQAEATLREALKLEPTYAAAANNLGLVLGAEGRFREAMDMFRRTNTEAEAYANLAYVLAQRGETAQAEQAYLRALTLNNTMRAAAQAMLQINERVRTQTRLASASSAPPSDTDQGPEPAASASSGVEAAVVLLPPPPASTPGQGPEQTVALSEAVGQGSQPVGPETLARPSEPPSVELVVKSASDSAGVSPQTKNVSGDADDRSN